MTNSANVLANANVQITNITAAQAFSTVTFGTDGYFEQLPVFFLTRTGSRSKEMLVLSRSLLD